MVCLLEKYGRRVGGLDPGWIYVRSVEADIDEVLRLVEQQAVEEEVGEMQERHGGRAANRKLSPVDEVQKCREGVERRQIEGERRSAAAPLGESRPSARVTPDSCKLLSEIVRLACSCAQNGPVTVVLRPLAPVWSRGYD